MRKCPNCHEHKSWFRGNWCIDCVKSRKIATFLVSTKMYTAARREHAFILRSEGMTFRAIGKRLGVSDTRAAQLWRIT